MAQNQKREFSLFMHAYDCVVRYVSKQRLTFIADVVDRNKSKAKYVLPATLPCRLNRPVSVI